MNYFTLEGVLAGKPEPGRLGIGGRPGIARLLIRVRQPDRTDFIPALVYDPREATLQLQAGTTVRVEGRIYRRTVGLSSGSVMLTAHRVTMICEHREGELCQGPYCRTDREQSQATVNTSVEPHPGGRRTAATQRREYPASKRGEATTEIIGAGRQGCIQNELHHEPRVEETAVEDTGQGQLHLRYLR